MTWIYEIFYTNIFYKKEFIIIRNLVYFPTVSLVVEGRNSRDEDDVNGEVGSVGEYDTEWQIEWETLVITGIPGCRLS